MTLQIERKSRRLHCILVPPASSPLFWAQHKQCNQCYVSMSTCYRVSILWQESAKGRDGFVWILLRPNAKRTTDGDQLADVIRRVIGHEQNGTQVRLVALAGGNLRSQIFDITRKGL